MGEEVKEPTYFQQLENFLGNLLRGIGGTHNEKVLNVVFSVDGTEKERDMKRTLLVTKLEELLSMAKTEKDPDDIRYQPEGFFEPIGGGEFILRIPNPSQIEFDKALAFVEGIKTQLLNGASEGKGRHVGYMRLNGMGRMNMFEISSFTKDVLVFHGIIPTDRDLVEAGDMLVSDTSDRAGRTDGGSLEETGRYHYMMLRTALWEELYRREIGREPGQGFTGQPFMIRE